MQHERIEASQVVDAACRELGINLADLIALASYWVHPEVVANAAGPRYPGKRRANLGLRVEGVQVEAVGQVINGISLDSNNYANIAFKQALGIPRQNVVGFHVCHIWPGTAYDAACYTHLANLVGIPAELASLTDHHPHIVACLKYRSWELYGWKPPAEPIPLRPIDYPQRWRPPYSASAKQVRSVPARSLPPGPAAGGTGPQPDAALQAAFYLSKFDHERLGMGNQSDTIDRLAAAFQVKRNTLKNYRDHFDSHTGSHRQGWKVELPPQMEITFRQLNTLDEATLRERILKQVEI